MSKEKELPLWEVFVQPNPGIPHKHAGSVHASDKEMALQMARDTYSRRSEGTSIWVVRSEEIVASDPNDADSFFDPANDKIYRSPQFYHLPEGAVGL
jgi:ring-1,2-phenylacetyl-CoA epoxidase subunit PaaB